MAGRGEGHFSRMVYGTGGIALDSRRPHRATAQADRAQERRRLAVIPNDELLGLVPDFQLDATTAALFGGDRLTSYELPWADTDANLLAIEFDDFAEAILADREPEVDGAFGLRSLAISYGFLESDRLGRFVTVDELLTSNELALSKGNRGGTRSSADPCLRSGRATCCPPIGRKPV